MADIPQVRSSLKRYKFSFLALTILGIVSTLYVTSSGDVGFSGENQPRNLISWKQIRKMKPAWQKLMIKRKDKLRVKKVRERNKRREKMAAKRTMRYKSKQARMTERAARKKIVWCLSYPFGGVDQLMKSVEYATGESMATMYGDQVYNQHFKLVTATTRPRWLNQKQFPEGPYLSNDVLPPPTAEKVLVKTHCGGFCTHDGPLRCRKEHEYFEGLDSVKTFSDMCISGKKRGPFTNESYSKRATVGVVAVIRDPVELVLARFQDYAAKGKYEYTTSGLYKYCAWNDRFFDGVSDMEAMRENAWMKPYFKEEVTPPPCYSEFFRVLRWQANAVDAVKNKKGLLFYYEDLTNPKYLDKSVNKIMDYMDMLRADDANDFPFENPDLSGVSFEDEDLVEIKDWMNAASNKYGREEIKKYFEA